MLKKKYRLNPKNFKSKLSVGSSFFSIKVSPNERKNSRFAFLVSGKTDKRAVVRNKIKRKIRSCVENLIDKIKPGFDFLFIVKKEIVKRETLDICTEVKKQFEKEGFLT